MEIIRGKMPKSKKAPAKKKSALEIVSEAQLKETENKAKEENENGEKGN